MSQLAGAPRRPYPPAPQRIYLMGTCLVDSFYPQAGMDAIQFFQQLGIEVIFPQAQTCCGQPAWNSGYEAEARAVARQQLRAFAEDIPVVVMMGSCTGMMHHEYPRLFAGEPEEQAACGLAKRTYEFSEFLIRILNVGFHDIGKTNLSGVDSPVIKVALHTSCSTRRGMGLAAEHQALVDRLPGVQRVEPERVTECCGFGGTFAVKQADISAAMAHDKAMAMAATGADLMTSADCGCLMNISGTMQLLEQQGQCQAMPVKHLATLVWEAAQSSRVVVQEGEA
ncbi:(Fe-S)-binding protein [Oceanobacter mangrovi]|uniref:(Fe-S)-binding protein n=1 Tax=Oceanobacter mangrovi TaxID=2862510 RepID=UPI001C8D6B7D|nr:(Fe-S)-binding protein [Oceanobacter mangrovi]